MSLKKLTEGFANFRQTHFSKRVQIYSSLAKEGQSPNIMVIACSDSRVSPSTIFSVEPNEIFVVRNIANLVPPYQRDKSIDGTSAAIEYATRELQVEHIIVLGHSQCGGIDNLCNNNERSNRWEFIDDWMSTVDAAKDSQLNGKALNRHVEKEAIKISLHNLLTFPWVKDRVDSGNLQVHGWWFDIKRATLQAYSAESNWVSLA